MVHLLETAIFSCRFGALLSISGSRMMYVGLSQNKLECVHGNEGTGHPLQQCGSLMCF